MVLLILLTSLLMASPTYLPYQEETPLTSSDNPALPTLSEQEWAIVDKEGNPVKRVRKLLEIAAGRLRQTHTLVKEFEIDEANNVLDNYQTIITYTLSFIDSLAKTNHKRARTAYKEFDLKMRKQIRILEELRRGFPVESRALEDSLSAAQRLRIMALNRFSGAEIIKVPEKPQE